MCSTVKLPTLRIALAEKMVELPEADSVGRIWRPGQTIEGFLELTSAFSLEMEVVSIRFEGNADIKVKATRYRHHAHRHIRNCEKLDSRSNG